MYSPLQLFEARFSSPLPSSLTPLWHQFSPLLSLLSHSPMESVLSSPLLSHSPMESVLSSPLPPLSLPYGISSLLSSPSSLTPLWNQFSPLPSSLTPLWNQFSPLPSSLTPLWHQFPPLLSLLSHSPMAPVPSPLHIVETHQHGVPSLLFLLLLLLPLFLLLSQPPCLERPVRALLSNVVCSDRICLYGNSMAQTALITWHRQH